MTDKKLDIFNAAREQFYAKGYKETNISDIAKKAGIGVGTFYNYYPSKEKLFLEVYFKENEEHKNHLFESVNVEEDPVTMITNMVIKNAQEMNSNRILKEWYNKDLFHKLEQTFYEQGGLEKFDEETHDGILSFIKKWKEEGKIRKDIEDEMISAMFKSILYIDIHKDDLGIENFPKILFYFTEFILKGLSDCPR